eukprot:c1202_g1_i1 orf=115-420(+)
MVDRVIKIFETHCVASGSKMNQEKSQAIWLGKDSQLEWLNKYGFQWLPRGQIMRHLGFPIGVGISAAQRAEWVLQRTEKKFHYCYNRPLSFGGEDNNRKAY